MSTALAIMRLSCTAANTADSTVENVGHYSQNGGDSGQARTEQREPLRILVLGQVKAGKSSLVNALFGEAERRPIAYRRRQEVTPYVLERRSLDGQVLLYDMGGYEDPSAPKERKAQSVGGSRPRGSCDSRPFPR